MKAPLPSFTQENIMDLQTPYFQAAGELMAQEQSLNIGKDWENKETHPRDPNCTLRYGVKDGVAFFQKIQHNMEDWRTFAAMKREQYRQSSFKERVSAMGQEKYALPHILVDDFNLRGLDVGAIMASSDHTEIDRIMLEEYPDLLFIPASAMRSKLQHSI